MRAKATILDVATLAGVSTATADRVLNERGGVTPDKERRVLSAARQLKFGREIRRAYAHRLRVAVAIQSAANPFHAELSQAFSAINREVADLNLQFLVHHLDPNQTDRIPALIDRLARQHDGLVVASPASAEIAAALRRAAATIPVATLATDIPDSGRHAYVGPDDEQGGRVAGDLMGRFIGSPGGKVLMIAGLLSMTGHRARERGFCGVLAAYFPACRVVAVEESGEVPERAGLVAAAMLRRHPDLRGIYLTSAGADAVAAVLRRTGRTDVAFITHELTADRRVLLRRREIQAVVDQDYWGEVRAVADTMMRLLGRADGDPTSVITPVRIYTSECC